MASIKKYETRKGTHYKITVCSGRDIHGKQIRHYKNWTPPPELTGRALEKELKRVAYEFEKNIDFGYAPDDRRTFAEYSAYCMELRKQRGDKLQTLQNTRKHLERINGYIGHIRIVDIRPRHLNEMYKKLSEPEAGHSRTYAHPVPGFAELIKGTTHAEFARRAGVTETTMSKVCNGKAISKQNAEKIEAYLNRKDIFKYIYQERVLSPGTIRCIHSIVCSVLAQAYKEMIVTYNAAERATLPKMQKVRESKTLQPEEIQTVIKALDTEPISFKTLIMFLMCTGCRRGEAIALTWDKIDWNKREVLLDRSTGYTPTDGIITGTTKTGKARIVALPPELIEQLRAYRQWQMEERTALYDAWEPTNLVFTRWNGQILNPNTVNRLLDEFCKRHDLPHINPHLFRHSAASILISNGVDVLSVSQMLGHSNISTTLNTYSHALEESRQKTAAAVSNVILQQKRA